MVMAEDDTDARDTHHVANDVVDGLDPAPSASQDEDLPPLLPSLLPSAEENEHLFVPPEGSFVCVALRDGVLTGSQSGSATPGRTQVPSTRSQGLLNCRK